MPQIFYFPGYQALSNSGSPLAGAKLSFFKTGTTTATAVYADAAHMTPLTNPVVADGQGRFPQIYPDPDAIYRVRLSDSSDVQQWQEDGVCLQLFPRTDSEIVPPVNYAYAPGDFVRFGASPTATADTNTTAINAALASANRVFSSIPGTYVINDNLRPKSGQVIDLTNDIVIQGAASKAWIDTGILDINGVSNVQVCGGTIDGNKANNAIGRAFGVRVYNSTNIRLFGTRAINCPGSTPAGVNGGDGFVIYGRSSDIELYGCIADGNVRQGLSIVQGTRIRVIGGTYLNTTGTEPGAGIDIEADGTNLVTDVSLIGVNCTNNQQGIVVTTGASKISIIGCQTRGNRANEMMLGDCEIVSATGNTFLGGSTVDGSHVVHIINADDVQFVGNIVVGSGAITERCGVQVDQSCNRVGIHNNTVRSTYSCGIRVGLSAMTAMSQDTKISGNLLVDCLNSSQSGAGAIFIDGNTGNSLYPLRVSVRDNDIYDSRIGGSEADFGVLVSSNISEATKSGYRIDGNHCNGPAVAGSNLPLRGSLSWNPSSLPDGAGETSTAILVTGAAFGDVVDVGAPYDTQALLVRGYVAAANTVKIRIQNESGGIVDLGSGTWTVHVRKLSE